ncbi:hypothetical protein SDC9_83164 [bioreactor metagenome]|uniref:Uncharacterized protein n=1 Tax=bioreactor metagenome TaxID=1076179 RepID=A0A644Z6Q3_9ZZZZ
MVVHTSSARIGLLVGVWVAVDLGKELLKGQQSGRHHPGLVTVVAGAPITFLIGMGDGDLG